MDKNLARVSDVSKSFGVSTRMLRYYEQNGLLESSRIPGYAYRVYDEVAVERLRQIVLLRKLQIPVKDIKKILHNQSAVTAIEVFEEKIIELNGEMVALSTIRHLLLHLLEELQKQIDTPLLHVLTADDPVLSAMDALSLVGETMAPAPSKEDLAQAESALSKITDIRIITIPPSMVASAHYIGDNPEDRTNSMVDAFVRENKLWEIKPDLRHYGFNHPNPYDETGLHGYEVWVTIPEDMAVPTPLEKKHFEGGLYAAHMISFGNFNEWEGMFAWLQESEKYEFAGDFADQEHMCGLLDEHLNYGAHVRLENSEPEDMQIDLLMPIRKK